MSKRITARRFTSLLFALSFLISTLLVPQVALAANAKGHTTRSNAYDIGKFSESIITFTRSYAGYFQAGDEYNYYKFTAVSGDKIAVSASVGTIPSQDGGTILSLYSSLSNVPLVSSSKIVYPPYAPNSPHNLVTYDISTSGSYYVEVRKTQNLDNITVSTVSFVDRTKSGSGTFSLTPRTVSCDGRGAVSAIASVNLSSDDSIPVGAIVESMSCSGTQSPSNYLRYNQIRPYTSQNWFETKQNSRAFEDITADDELLLKTTWQYRYRTATLAPATTMRNISIDVDYNYDPTDAWIQ